MTPHGWHRLHGRARRRSRQSQVGLILVIAALTGCGLGAEFSPVFERIEFPPDWEFISEEHIGFPCTEIVETCPETRRYYQVPTETYRNAALRILEGLSFEVSSVPAATCDSDLLDCRISGHDDENYISIIPVEVNGEFLTVRMRVSDIGEPFGSGG